MKKYLLLLVFSLLSHSFFAQAFLNGDFETNTSNVCDYNLADSVFNTMVPNVFAFGKKYMGQSFGFIGETDIQTSGCYVTPQNGNWCLGLSSDTTATSDAVALELTSPLNPGQNYLLSFSVFSNTNFSLSATNLKIGASTSYSTFGTLVSTVVPIPNSWKSVVLSVTVSQACKYITVTNVSGIKAWNQIDNFKIGTTTGLEKIESPVISFFPNPCNSVLTINTSSVLKNARLTLYDSQGQKVKSIYPINEQSFSFNRDQLQSGIYYVELVQDNTTILRKKLVIID